MRFAASIFVLLFASQAATAQYIELPDNPLRGRIVFEDKGCIECHAIQGYGGDSGPDLSKDHYYGSFLHLAATIWNHTPEMDRKFRQMGVQRPKLSEEEFLNLTGFIYYLKYLGQPGSVSRGASLVESRGCTTCHGGSRQTAPDFAEIDQNASPLFMVQSMWNHGPEMAQEMQDMGLAFPKMSGSDISDIAAYLRMVAVVTTDVGMSPGSPVSGAELFEEKRCSSCHAASGDAEKIGPNLSDFDMRKSVTEIAGSMWNHSPMMFEFMEEEGIEWPRLEGKEMADLLSYLYFLGFEGTPGDPEAGEFVFGYNGCEYCHTRGGDGIAPGPEAFPRLDSPVRMIQAMWNHAPEMEDEILIRNEEWPRLTEREMQDLYAFLSTLERE